MSTQVEQLEAAIKAALERAFKAGSLSGQIPEAIKLERPKDRDHGEIMGAFAGIDDDGVALLRLADGAARVIHAGDVFLL